MRLCSVKDLNVGDVIGKSIYLANNKLLLGAGYRITEDIRDKLAAKGYSHVYIMEEDTEDIIPEDIISEEIRLEARLKLKDKVDSIKAAEAFQEMSYSKAVETLESGRLKHIEITYDMREIVKEIINQIAAADIKFMNTIMVKSKDDSFFDHSINTAVLAILLGKKFRYTKPELTDLAMGAFLHDIGKIIIEQLQHDSDSDYYREHPTFGYLILKSDPNISPLVLQTVNQHHEQQDGNGFPIRLKGNNQPPVKSNNTEKGIIFRFAEICCVADAYDRCLLSPLNEKEDDVKMGPFDVIKVMMEKAGTVYNRSIVEALTQIVPAYPVGSYVRIENIVDPVLIGSYGVVAKINENDMKHPTVIITTDKFRKKIKPVIIDTSKLTHVELKLLI